MAAQQEVFRFVHKFMNLCRNGESANLSMQCNQGKATINLQLNLQQYPPPSFRPYPPPRQHPPPYHQPSPSRLRQYARHAQTQVQNEKVSKSEKVDLFSPNANNDTILRSNATKQVVVSSDSKITADKAAH